MFVPAFQKLAAVGLEKINWKAWALFLWYVYQMSTFHRDRRYKKSNVYSSQTYLAANSQKRRHYGDWLASLDCYHPEYNQQIRSVLKEVT
ncbi:hypothetical protein [Mycoplasma sp. ATU-Cv-508]|uniref:hypothetical protein n=1 Tax=Mycoplasma sp. ATU-Cv-508 TaxID=2048001 RepID=UPI000FDF56C2